MKQLLSKYNLYRKLSKREQDRDGFIHSDKCDSILFSSLLAVGVDSLINIKAAYDGRYWYRRPLKKGECWKCGESRSTISRDMLLGVMWYIWHFKQEHLAISLWKSVWKNCLRMGQGRWWGADTFMNPTMIATLAQLCNILGYSTFWTRLWAKLPHRPGKAKGFSRHLQCILILLNQRIYGIITEKEKQALQRNYEEQPTNPLHAYAAGHIAEASWLLLNSPFWPATRLPTGRDCKEEWPIQRDFGDSGLEPGTSNKTHSGGDFLFVAALVLGKI